MRGVLIRIPRVNFHGHLILPGQFLGLLPGCVRVRNEELNANAHLETLPYGGGQGGTRAERPERGGRRAGVESAGRR